MLAAARSLTRLLAVVALGCAACSASDEAPPPADPTTNPDPVSTPDLATQLASLSQRTIYFGHQSVGGNIMDGVRALIAANTGAEPLVRWYSGPTSLAVGTWAESGIGSNYDPVSKIDAFRTIVNGGAGAKLGVAFMKFCWVDFDGGAYWTNGGTVASLFATYRSALDGLKAAYPGVTFVHFTTPLYVDTALNARREQYNELVRDTYGGKEPVFDLALVESTRPDGTRELGAYGPALVPAYTTDGGHLNATGEDVVARALVALLASLP